MLESEQQIRLLLHFFRLHQGQSRPLSRVVSVEHASEGVTNVDDSLPVCGVTPSIRVLWSLNGAFRKRLALLELMLCPFDAGICESQTFKAVLEGLVANHAVSQEVVLPKHNDLSSDRSGLQGFGCSGEVVGLNSLLFEVLGFVGKT